MHPTHVRIVAASWGVVGVLATLVEAIARLTYVAWQGLRDAPAHVLAFTAVWCAMNAYAEGYRGFQKRFVPRAVERAFELEGTRAVLAPLVCLGLVFVPGPELRRGWALLLTIVALVVAVRHLPQPWRGAIDAGVVVGLAWGAVALAAAFVARLGRVRARAAGDGGDQCQKPTPNPMSK